MCTSGLPKIPMPNAAPNTRRTAKNRNTAARAMAGVGWPLETGAVPFDTLQW
jgi:hypothetical protein